ncbi:MAG: GerAB/ArcD/ProY family transporter [Bacillota bacterium]
MVRLRLPEDRITASQLAISLISTIVGVEAFIMPRSVVESAGRDGWLSILIGGVLAILVVLGLCYLGTSYPGESPVTYFAKILGKVPGNFTISVFLVFYLCLCGWVLRIFGDMVKVYLLTKTPIEVIIFSMLLTAAYLVNHGLNPLVRAIQVFFPLLIIPVAVVILMVQGLVDYRQLLPVMSGGLLPVLKGSINGYVVFSGFGIIAFLLPSMTNPREGFKAASLGMGLVVGIYLIIFILTIAHFGPVETGFAIYPVIDLVREVRAPGAFLERLDLLLLFFWILTVFISVAVLFYVVVLGFSQLLGLKEQRPLVYLVLPLIYLVAMRPRDFDSTELLGLWMGYGSMALASVVLLMILIVWVKKLPGGGKNAR